MKLNNNAAKTFAALERYLEGKLNIKHHCLAKLNCAILKFQIMVSDRNNGQRLTAKTDKKSCRIVCLIVQAPIIWPSTYRLFTKWFLINILVLTNSLQ